MSIYNLSIPYPDFKLNEIIDPDQMDANFADIQDKVNELVSQTNVVLADDFVTTTRIKNESVVAEKLAPNSVTVDKILDGTLTVEKINVTSFDLRYYTETEIDKKFAGINATLNAKTNNLGDHAGTWQGLKPTDIQGATQAIELASIRNTLTNHIADVNPHNVTPDMIGAWHDGTSDTAYALLNSYRVRKVASSVDSEGIYTKVEKLRPDGSLYSLQELSNQDADGNYLNMTETLYYADGVTVDKVVNYQYSYDSNGIVLDGVII